MATAWPSIVGTGDWDSDRHGVEAPWPLALSKNYTQRDIKPQKTPRAGAEYGEVEEGEQGMWDIRTWRKPFRNGRGMGRLSRPEGGRSDVQTTEAGRWRKGPSDIRNPGSYMYLGSG